MTPAELEAQRLAGANGANEARAVKRYLEIVGGKRGRPRNSQTVGRQLERTKAKLANSRDELTRLNLNALRMQLERDLKRLEKAESSAEMTAARAGFIAHAKNYGKRNGIPRGAWKSAGVDRATMLEAGL